MAFFKFRWPGAQEPQGDSSPPAKRSRTPQAESIDEMRRRARHRLIGAAVLVLAGVVGFPLLFDSQPRPIPVDVAIDIPDRNKVAALAVPSQAKGASQDASRGAAAAPAPASGDDLAAASLDAGEEQLAPRARSQAVTPAPAQRAQAEPKVEPKAEPRHDQKAEARPRPEVKPEPKPEPKPESKPEPRPEPKPEPRPPVRQDDSARARALLEGRDLQASAAPAPAAQEQGRFIVQVGAFADADKAREVRDRLERSGLKTYTQVVDTKDGKRTRVRIGPFTSRADADKAAARVKGVGLAASVLAL